MKRTLAVVAITLSLGTAALAAKPRYIGMKRARAIASRQASGRITSAELEKEHGRMIYSFDIKQRSGKVVEVNINAYTGAVIGRELESASDESREKAEDKQKKH